MIPLADKETLTALKAKLRSRKKNIREEAGKAILELGQQGTELLIEIIEEERPRQRRQKYYSIVYTIVVILWLMHQFKFRFWIMLPIYMTPIWNIRSMRTQTQNECYNLLTQSTDKRSIPYLLEALHTNDTARSALIRLLPQLVFEDITKLHLLPKHRNILHKNLSIHSRDFTIACLKALEQIGDETSIEPILKYRSKLYDYYMRDLCDTCLEYLRTNAERNTNAQTLLRASSIEAGNTNELLRPLSNTPAEPSEELLRPSSNIDTNDRVSPQ